MKIQTFSPTRTRSGVRASAGSGKTYDLTSYYLRSLLQGAEPREILATTFTRKAAGEILGRVLLRLCDACETPEEFESFLNGLGVQNFSFEQGRELLLALCGELHHVKISTIDSFFGQMLRSYCHDLGVSADLRIVEEDAPEVERIRNEAIRQVLSMGERPKILQILDSLQSGRAAYRVTSSLLEQFERAHKHFEVASPDAWEQKYSLRPQLTESEFENQLDTLENWSSPELSKSFLSAIKKDVKRARNEDWGNFLDTGLANKVLCGEELFSRKEIPADLRVLYQPLVDHAASTLLEQHRLKTLTLRDALELYHKRYCALREQEGILLFLDVPLQLSRFMADLTPQEVAHRLDSKIDYLLLDEFQDTAPQQYAILKPFAQQIMSLPEQKGLLFCVGDLKQSIYGWRGATPEVFAQLEEEFPQIHWSDSDHSYRSSSAVLSAINQLFGSLSDNAGISDEWKTSAQEWSTYFNAHQAKKTELSGYVELLQSPPQEEPKTTDGESESASTADSHLEFAAKRIEKFASQAPHATVGVLVRSNATATTMIYLLRKLGVAATGEAGSALSDNPAVALILSALRFAEHPGDKIALFHLLNSPLAQTLRLRGKVALEPSLAASELRRGWHENGFAFSIAAWSELLASECDHESALCLEQLVHLAEQYSLNSASSGEEFIAQAQKQSVASAAEAQVRVMTIHKSKGLEFDAVFLPELHPEIRWTEKLLISREPKTQEIRSICVWPNELLRNIEPSLQTAFLEHASSVIREAFCVLYVAMTRAKRALYLIVPAIETTKGGKIKKTPFSPASIVRAGLCGEASLADTAPTTQLYAQGDPLWHQAEETMETSSSDIPAESTLASTLESTLVSKEKEISNWENYIHIPRNWQRVSPSIFEEGVQRKAFDLLRQEKSEAAIRGSLIHELFSRLEWFEPQSVRDSIKPNVIKRIAQRVAPEFSQEVVDECLDSFWKMLESSTIQSHFQRPSLAIEESVEVWRERRFAVHVDGKLVVGQFDRVLVFSSGGKAVRAEIIDFKTGTTHPAKVEQYKPQMTLYQKALQKQLALAAEKVGCRILFVEEGIAHDMQTPF